MLDFSPRPSLSPPPSGDRSTPPGRGGGCGGCSECLVPRSRRPTRLCPPGCHLAEGHCGPILTSSLPLFALWTAEEGQTDSQRGDRESPRETEEPGGRSSTWTSRGWATFRAECDNKTREVTPCCLCRLTGTLKTQTKRGPERLSSGSRVSRRTRRLCLWAGPVPSSLFLLGPWWSWLGSVWRPLQTAVLCSGEGSPPPPKSYELVHSPWKSARRTVRVTESGAQLIPMKTAGSPPRTLLWVSSACVPVCVCVLEGEARECKGDHRVPLVSQPCHHGREGDLRGLEGTPFLRDGALPR